MDFFEVLALVGIGICAYGILKNGDEWRAWRTRFEQRQDKLSETVDHLAGTAKQIDSKLHELTAYASVETGLTSNEVFKKSSEQIQATYKQPRRK